MIRSVLSVLAGLACAAGAASAQHSQVSSVAVRPSDPGEVWVANRANDSVSVIDAATGVTLHEIQVGVWPRSLAFHPDGTRVYVANQRGNVPVTTNFLTPFTGAEVRGSVSVIDVATKTVVKTLTDVGVEPYGIAFAPNGAYYAVSGFRSGTLKLFDAKKDQPLVTVAYPRQLEILTAGTALDVDQNGDMLPDLAEPRAFVIRADSKRIFVTHLVPGFVSVVDVALNGPGKPIAASIVQRIDLDTYAPHPVTHPVGVQEVKSQGDPRFLDDVALSPDGTRLLVPSVLHNVAHDVNHDFGGAIAGDFANRVYPALSVVDAAALSFAAPGDASARLHHELDEPLEPAAYVAYGPQGVHAKDGVYTLGGTGAPQLGGQAILVHTGHDNQDEAVLLALGKKTSVPLGPLGTLLNTADFGVFAMTPLGAGAVFSKPLASNPAWEGVTLSFQAAVVSLSQGTLLGFSNGLDAVLSADAPPPGGLGLRAGHPSRVAYSPDGAHALLLNRGSEDLFLYSVSGSELALRTVFPPRHGFVERAPLDVSTPLGDLPIGLAVVPDPATINDDARVYVMNETTRTLSVLRVDWATGVITQERAQIPTLLGPDAMTASERLGEEIFEDASRAQTAGNFNNSCASCHFEGGADGNVWQRPAGPRSTMQVYGGTLGTGLVLWKGVRLSMGETGPMFGGENGGHGLFTDVEQQALIDYHEVLPVPLNPNLDPATGTLTPEAARGRDLFFGINDTGTNPTLRSAGCFTCHPDKNALTLEARGYTTDFLIPELTQDPGAFELLDPLCFSLQENIAALNIRNVNSGVNVDVDHDGVPEADRNSDGYVDLETYAPLNADAADDFTRDDPNSYMCPEDGIPGNPLKVFTRPAHSFSVPTKLGAFSTGPYFHDHSAASLRAIVDPASQTDDPIYAHPAYPGLQKFYNEFHDVRGHEDFVAGASKVQFSLKTAGSGYTIQQDVDALLAFIRSL